MKKILCVVICMLMFVATSIVSTAKLNIDDSTVTTNDNYFQSGKTPKNPGDILLQFDVQTNTTFQGFLGAEWDGEYFWTTGCAAGSTAPFFIIKWDNRGHLVQQYPQPAGSSTGWGMRDMAFDGTYLYAGAEGGFWQIDPTTGATTTLFTSISPMTVIRALAWVPSENMFYTASFGASWYKFSPDGTSKIPITNPGLTGEYGMAYDSVNDSIWVFNQETTSPQTVFHEYNYHTNTLTGKIWQVPFLGGNTAQLAGGAFYATDIVSGKATLGGMVQGTPLDRLFVMELGITNLPPATPGAPSGPTSGNMGTEYTFTASTTDPEGDNVQFMFDWGDGNFSEWTTPSSGSGSAAHAWYAVGSYDIKVKAKDAVHGGESDWSPTHTMTILAAPVLKVEWIRGGLFKVSASIKNVGGVPANNTAWTITLTGGAFIGKETIGTENLGVGTPVIIKSNFILGFGATVVKVTLTHPDSSAAKEVPGKVLLFFIKI